MLWAVIRAFGRCIQQRDFRHRSQLACGFHIRDREMQIRAPGWPTRSIIECRQGATTRTNEMTIASELLQQHIHTLVDDNTRWQRLIADDILWELAYAPSLGHPAQLSGRKEAVRHATWFVGAVENFHFFDLNVYALADVQGAVAEVKGEGSLSLRAVCITRIMWSSCGPWTARSRS